MAKCTLSLGGYDQHLHDEYGSEEHNGQLAVLSPMLHEIVVFSDRVDSQQAHHPNSTDAEEVCRWDVVDILQEEETQIVDLELNR